MLLELNSFLEKNNKLWCFDSMTPRVFSYGPDIGDTGPSCRSVLLIHISTTSSTYILKGNLSVKYICTNSHTLTSFSESPLHLLTMELAEMLKKVVLHSVATALANRVLPAN